MIPINLLEAYYNNFYVFALIVYVSNGFVQKKKDQMIRPTTCAFFQKQSIAFHPSNGGLKKSQNNTENK